MLLWEDGELRPDKHPLVEGLTRAALSLVSYEADAGKSLRVLSLPHAHVFYALKLKAVALASGQLALAAGICILGYDKSVFLRCKAKIITAGKSC